MPHAANTIWTQINVRRSHTCSLDWVWRQVRNPTHQVTWPSRIMPNCAFLAKTNRSSARTRNIIINEHRIPRSWTDVRWDSIRKIEEKLTLAVDVLFSATLASNYSIELELECGKRKRSPIFSHHFTRDPDLPVQIFTFSHFLNGWCLMGKCNCLKFPLFYKQFKYGHATPLLCYIFVRICSSLLLSDVTHSLLELSICWHINYIFTVLTL